ncbi:calcium-binding protein [Nocardioides sp. zg-1228]|uniref:calcium-binding protein n=1 Tax=Nocardioides sp. zg-1228 TaxID=2763008 RepID=UPI0016430564|nr:hypothetical protein [Nocardioides sp. zg-1228]MBC2933372.1 hypothetical protein [Nocardioides sp. zg-1228]QSF56471.1 hypothetical protein JX575_12565 [Nocardioides sp. zg-1228]
MTLAVASLLVPVAPAGSTPSAAAPRCAGRVATIVGTAGADRLVGTPRADVIVALAGRDHIDARGGDDLVCGGPGGDVIQGGSGDDRLLGEGNDWRADRGGVHVFGDVLDGGAGDDVLDVGPATPAAEDLVRDRVEFRSAPGAVVVDLAVGTATGQGEDVFRRVPRLSVRTGAGDDTIRGTEGADDVDAGPGDDTVVLLGGADFYREGRTSLSDDDVVDTGRGADVVRAASGADRITTGRGADDVTLRGRGPVTLETGPASDTVVAPATDRPGASYDLGPGAENHLSLDPGPLDATQAGLPIRVDVPAGLLTLTLAGGPVDARIAGIRRLVLDPGFRIDFLGGAADETLDVAPRGSIPLHAVMGAGDDRVWGTRGDDHIDGGDGVDTAYGDEGDDTCVNVEEPTDC